MNCFRFLAACLLLSAACAASADVNWPDLPTSGFIYGRPATVDDVSAGMAAFSQQGSDEGVLDITIPQYAIWTDEAGSGHSVIVIQGERGPNGMRIVGFRYFDGTEGLATIEELKLLGTERPN